MVTDEQVRLLMSLLNQGISQATASAKAGMSERTARKYAHSARSPSQSKVPHTWRTRPDPFAEVWLEVVALLQQAPTLIGRSILCPRHAGRRIGLWPRCEMSKGSHCRASTSSCFKTRRLTHCEPPSVRLCPVLPPVRQSSSTTRVTLSVRMGSYI